MRLAQQARGLVRPRQDPVSAHVRADARVGEVQLREVTGARGDPGLHVEAELAEQEVQPVLGEVAQMANRDGFRAGDAVRVGLLEADELDPVGGDALFERGEWVGFAGGGFAWGHIYSSRSEERRV